jgi:hypothetical protein
MNTNNEYEMFLPNCKGIEESRSNQRSQSDLIEAGEIHSQLTTHSELLMLYLTGRYIENIMTRCLRGFSIR